MPETKPQDFKLEKYAYSEDASGISGKVKGIYFPKTADDIRRIVKANQNIVVRGGGTGLAGGCVPRKSVVVDMSKMDKILNIDKQNMIAEVQAGVILDELNEILEGYNLEFPVQPSSHKACTIGGMIACNAVGSRAIKYGRTQNWIESLELVDGKAYHLTQGKADLSDIIGFEGITGIIVKARLKLIDKKYRTASLLSFTSFEDVIFKVKEIRNNSDISMIEILDKKISDMIGLDRKYHLIIEYESTQGSFKDKDYEKLMEKRDSAYPTAASEGYLRIDDPKLFLDKIKEFTDFLEKIDVPFFGHLGSGIIHPCFKEEQKSLREDTMRYAKKLQAKVTGEHGYGILKREFVDPNDKKIMINVKKRYDPLCKINCGNIIDFQISNKDENDTGKKEEKQNEIGEKQ